MSNKPTKAEKKAAKASEKEFWRATAANDRFWAKQTCPCCEASGKWGAK
jgi:hypothetical protein